MDGSCSNIRSCEFLGLGMRLAGRGGGDGLVQQSCFSMLASRGGFGGGGGGGGGSRGSGPPPYLYEE